MKVLQSDTTKNVAAAASALPDGIAALAVAVRQHHEQAFQGQYLDARVREGEIKADVANTALERQNPPYREGAPP